MSLIRIKQQWTVYLRRHPQHAEFLWFVALWLGALLGVVLLASLIRFALSFLYP